MAMTSKDLNLNKYLTTDNLLLGIIVLVGTILRFYHFDGLHMTYDEFSAYFRTKFDNLGDLIENGVKKSDTHPPGVQVFLYYWVKLSGSNEALFKLPFIISGIFSIFMVYKLAKTWFNPTVGLLTALFLSVLQYPITYNLMARPYAPGLLFVLIYIWFWTKYIFKSAKMPYLVLSGFILSGAISAYIHHFALLMVGLVGISGFIFVKGKMVWQYLLALFIMFLLYLPNLSIFIVQLGEGGVESWLSKPDAEFIVTYVSYVLHYSPILIGSSILLVLLGIYLYSPGLGETNKFRLLSISWFLVTYYIAYFYSLYINAVLQFSVLIFVFPFMVMFFFSWIDDLKPKLKIFITITFTALAIYTLVFNRQHYTILYHMAYREILVADDEIRQKIGPENVASIIHIPHNIRDFYLDKLSLDGNHIKYLEDAENYISFREYVETLQQPYLILAWTSMQNMEYLEIAHRYYPQILQKNYWYKGDFYLLSKERMDNENPYDTEKYIYQSVNKVESYGSGWNATTDLNLAEGVNYPGDLIYHMLPETEFSVAFRSSLNDIIENENNVLSISVDGYTTADSTSAAVVCELYSKDRLIYWRAAKFSEFIKKPQRRETVYLTLKLADMGLNHPDITLKSFIWNPAKENLYFDDFSVVVREGNPYVYGLFKKIH
ncbi:MAG: glycosyltransferase family 39 protein [Bacteroidales bacterium]|nr:glycosyltransferase family 39 protein [Bacteroidales bacterium]